MYLQSFRSAKLWLFLIESLMKVNHLATELQSLEFNAFLNRILNDNEQSGKGVPETKFRGKFGECHMHGELQYGIQLQITHANANAA